MTDIKLGDLVMLKSGGPVMTVDAINTDIFDDSKVTGVLCVWFVGDQLQRVRFDHRALEPASPATKPAAPHPEPGAYTDSLASMMTEMNATAEPPAAKPAGRSARKPARKTARGKPERSPTHPGAGTA